VKKKHLNKGGDNNRIVKSKVKKKYKRRKDNAKT